MNCFDVDFRIEITPSIYVWIKRSCYDSLLSHLVYIVRSNELMQLISYSDYIQCTAITVFPK